MHVWKIFSKIFEIFTWKVGEKNDLGKDFLFENKKKISTSDYNV